MERVALFAKINTISSVGGFRRRVNEEEKEEQQVDEEERKVESEDKALVMVKVGWGKERELFGLMGRFGGGKENNE